MYARPSVGRDSLAGCRQCEWLPGLLLEKEEEIFFGEQQQSVLDAPSGASGVAADGPVVDQGSHVDAGGDSRQA